MTLVGKFILLYISSDYLNFTKGNVMQKQTCFLEKNGDVKERQYHVVWKLGPVLQTLQSDCLLQDKVGEIYQFRGGV